MVVRVVERHKEERSAQNQQPLPHSPAKSPHGPAQPPRERAENTHKRDEDAP
jgi:hypothetical protein